jgi:hypothetical protein
MADRENVTIVAWPKDPAKLSHTFDKPCPVSISFEKTPASVVVQSSREQPLHVDMTMRVVPEKVIPVCIQMCEPICAASDYTIGIDIFDRPVASIKVKGMTRLFNCGEAKGEL